MQQQFKGKFQNTPRDASQVPCSVSTSLNRVERLSETNKVRPLNNLDVNPLQRKGEQGLRVPVIAYVLNQRGQALMPCSSRKARILLKKGEAKVVRTNPFFVIQLTKATGEQIQKCSLGIDSGYKNVGFSVITSKKELTTGTLILDQRTSKRLMERRMYRRGRRNRLWYRQPRFDNRTKKQGWLPPSIQRRFNTQVTLINRLKKLLPVKLLKIEVGNFDIQKIENPDIAGIQYQQGSMYEYQNMRSFLMAREQGRCQLCGKEFSKGNSSHIHHISPRNQSGPDREKNLALLHKRCHKKLHKQKLFSLLKENKQYKDATFMSIVRWKFRETFPECSIIYGNETFVKRNSLHLEKTHYNDAFVIAGGIDQKKAEPIQLWQKHRNSRVLQLNRKGFKPSIRKQRYSIQPYDFITVGRKKYTVKGCFSYGTQVACIGKNFNIKKVNKVFHTSSVYTLTRFIM